MQRDCYSDSTYERGKEKQQTSACLLRGTACFRHWKHANREGHSWSTHNNEAETYLSYTSYSLLMDLEGCTS
jgi:hypothetical protein